MKHFAWDERKNDWLKAYRQVSFEEVILRIDRGEILDVVDHPNRKRYSGQRILIVEIDDYGYLVPFVENEHEVFLKTIIPSRKVTRKYLGR